MCIFITCRWELKVLWLGLNIHTHTRMWFSIVRPYCAFFKYYSRTKQQQRGKTTRIWVQYIRDTRLQKKKILTSLTSACWKIQFFGFAQREVGVLLIFLHGNGSKYCLSDYCLIKYRKYSLTIFIWHIWYTLHTPLFDKHNKRCQGKISLFAKKRGSYIIWFIAIYPCLPYLYTIWV